ncbi:MAG: prepilin-type N-terminal cleavage/methylation domain-containing protein [Acidimicrobiales bacterium]
MFSTAIQRLHDRRHAAGDIGEDSGFTLIELMVVLLILAILLAIAIPTFLGVTKSANDRAAQSNLNTAFVNAKASFQQNSQSYATSTTLTTALSTAEPSLQFTTGASTSQSLISVDTSADGFSVIMAAQAKSTLNCWYLIDNTQSEAVAAPWTGAVWTGAGTWYGEVKNAATCTASSAPVGTTSTTTLFQTSGGFPAL